MSQEIDKVRAFAAKLSTQSIVHGCVMLRDDDARALARAMDQIADRMEVDRKEVLDVAKWRGRRDAFKDYDQALSRTLCIMWSFWFAVEALDVVMSWGGS